MPAQDDVFARLALERRALAPDALNRAQAALRARGRGSLAGFLVEGGVLSRQAAQALVAELSRFRYVCPGCAASFSYEELAPRADLRCRCQRWLEPRSQSGASPLVQPTRPRDHATVRLGSGSHTAAGRAPGSGTHVGPPGSGVHLPGPPPSGAHFEAVGSSFNEVVHDAEALFADGVAGSASFRSGAGSGRLESGARVGPYLLVQELGRGSHGVVFLARSDERSEPLALKILLDGAFADEETVARFQLEAAIGVKLTHPGVIRVFDVGRHADKLYYAMEYCPGRTLRQRMKDSGCLPPGEGLDLILELARTLSACHALGVIHRDVKPGNVILDPRDSDRPRLTDFGLARDRSLMESMTRTGDILGTPYYMAPEQFRGERDLDHRVDIYALGVILYQLLTGERPYEAATPVLLARAVESGDPRPPRELAPEVPARLEAICLKAMARDPEERYPSAAELVEDLEACRAGGSLKHARIAASSSALALGALAVAVLLTGGLGAAWILRDGEATPAASAPLARGTPSEAGREALAQALAALDQPEPSLVQVRALLERAQLDVRRDPTFAQQVGRALRRLEGHEALAEVTRLATQHAPLERLEAALAQARERAGDDEERARVALLGADLLLRRWRFAAAQEALEPLLGAPAPTGVEAQLLDAYAREGAGRMQQAQLAFKALASGEAGPVAKVARAAAGRLAGAERAEQAERARRELSEVKDHPFARLEEAYAQLELGDHEAAEVALGQALAERPDDASLHHAMGRVKLREGKGEAAGRALSLARKLCEDHAERLDLHEGVAHLIHRRPQRAVEALERVLRREPDEVTALVVRGLASQQTGQEEQAVYVWRRAERKDPEVARAALRRWFGPAELSYYEEAVGPRQLDSDAQPPRPGPPGPRPRPPGPAPALGGGVTLQELLTQAQQSGQHPPYAAITPLGEVSPGLSQRLARLPAQSPLERDVATAQGRAARGRPWEEVLHTLLRALRLDSSDLATLRAGLELSLARGDTEIARKVLSQPVLRLAPHEEEAARARYDWQRGALGAALTRWDALAQGSSPAAREGRAWGALLRGDYAGAQEALRQPSTAREWTCRGLALAGQGQLEQAHRCAEEAYREVGARDGALLALRAVLAASHFEQDADMYTQMMRGMLSAEKGTGVSPGAQLGLTSSPAFGLLAARIALESSRPDHSLLAARLLSAPGKEQPFPEQLLLRAYRALRGGEAEASEVLGAWKAARARDPKLVVPRHFREAYAEAYGTRAGLDELE